MNRISDNIEYLIRRHDCVVIPSWGALVANYRSATYDQDNSLFYPPVREISFNPGIEHNDGLLASSIARHESITFNKATKIVEEEVGSMKHQLESLGEVTLGRVGKFIYQKGSTPSFEPSEELIRFESASLNPVIAKPVIKEAKEEARIAETAIRRRRFGLQVARIAAAVAMLIAIASVIILPPMFNRNDQLASVTSTDMFSTKAAEEVENFKLKPLPANLVLSIALPSKEQPANTINIVSEEVAPAEMIKAEETVEPQLVIKTTPDRYCLVVASLPTNELAERYIRESGDDNLGIMLTDGRYRVYAATASTSSNLLKIKESTSLAVKYPDSWVCRMK